MHGFAEDPRYFSRYYAGDGAQPIAINSCGYHLPVIEPRYAEAAWATVPQAGEGTIPVPEQDKVLDRSAMEARARPRHWKSEPCPTAAISFCSVVPTPSPPFPKPEPRPPGAPRRAGGRVG